MRRDELAVASRDDKAPARSPRANRPMEARCTRFSQPMTTLPYLLRQASFWREEPMMPAFGSFLIQRRRSNSVRAQTRARKCSAVTQSLVHDGPELMVASCDLATSAEASISSLFFRFSPCHYAE